MDIMKSTQPALSIIIPARNEEGHIERIFQEMPQVCAEMELVFIEGNSTDCTWEEIQKCADNYKDSFPKILLLQQDGKGKADAVWKGIAHSTGDIVLILDSDLTVPPSMLHKFYDPISKGEATFTYGSRLIYPMEPGAMRFWNHLANKAFAIVWRPLFRMKVTDSLCGTKVFLREDYEKTKKKYPHIFRADPFGDFALFFIALANKCKIKEIPVRYRARQYGTTNIPRWKGGVRLLWVYVLCAISLLFDHSDTEDTAFTS